MRVVFMGTPDFAVPSLEALADAHEVVAVYTQPDRPSGRGRTPAASPVKRAALRRGVPVLQPPTLRDPEVQQELRDLAPDVICVAAYGLLLPPEVLEIPPHGCLNVHASLLPRHRGAAPVHRAILEGDTVTGVSIMLMEEGLDTGPYALQVEVPVGESTAEELAGLLASAGARALLDVLGRIDDGSVEWTAQDDALATYAAKVGRDDVALAPELTVSEALRRVRASTPSAPCRACVSGRPVTITRVSPDPESGRTLEPGGVVVTKRELVLGLADGAIVLDEIKPQGRGCMDGACFARGAHLDDSSVWERCP